MESRMDTGTVVEARAPGKVIISGEHAVVHGTAAVAAALSRCTIVRMNRPPAANGEGGILSLDLPELKLQLRWPVQYIKKYLDLPLTEMHPLATNQTTGIKTVIEDFLKREIPSNADKGASSGVAAFLFLYISILGLQPLEVIITSELPVGSGLGSSAALCVAITGALLTLAGKLELKSDKSKSPWMDIEEKGLDLVNIWAFEGEKIIHGRPSGVDNTVSCYGHVVRFKKGILTRLQDPMQLRMLITNTNVSRNTKALVAGVAERADRHPTAMTAVFNAVEAISEEIVSILESPSQKQFIERKESTPGDTERAAADLVVMDGMIINTSDVDGTKGQAPTPMRPKRLQEVTQLEELMVMNQGLLQCMGVSHPSIEEICQITSRFDLCSKLTGAGGGGCVLTLLPNEPSDTVIQNVKTELELAGYLCFEAAIGGTGLRVGYRTSLLPDY